MKDLVFVEVKVGDKVVGTNVPRELVKDTVKDMVDNLLMVLDNKVIPGGPLDPLHLLGDTDE